MSELPKFESAERGLLIEPETGYFRAQQFGADPVAYFKNFKAELVSNEFNDEEMGIQAMGEMQELEEIISNEDVPIPSERVKNMLTAEYHSQEWAEATFGILKEAGFTKEQLLLWLTVEDDELTPTEKLLERGLMYFLQEIYGTR